METILNTNDTTAVQLSSDVKDVTKTFLASGTYRECSVVTGAYEHIIVLKADSASMGTAEVDGVPASFGYAVGLLVNAEEVQQLDVQRKGEASNCLGGLEAWKLTRLMLKAGIPEDQHVTFILQNLGRVRAIFSIARDLTAEEGNGISAVLHTQYADQIKRSDNAAAGFWDGSDA